MLAAVGTAHAAGPYYAAPAGSGTACSEGTPCQLNQAVLSGGTNQTVLLEPGTHTLTNYINVPAGWTVRPKVPGTRPVILNTSAADPTFSVSLGSADTTIQDIRIEATSLASAAWALRLQPGTAKRMEIFTQGPSGAFAVLMEGGALTDSVVWARGASFPSGVTTSGSGALLRNDTIVASGDPVGASGLFTNGSYAGANHVLTIQNSIVRGDNVSMNLSGDPAHLVTANVTNSNYNPPAIGFADVTFNDLGGMQSTAPMFADPTVTGDFRQVTGSTTINGGAAVPGLSATGLDGQARCLGTAPDIGADEFTGSACPVVTTTTPSLAATSTPAKKCTKGRKLKRGKCVKKKRRKR